MTKEEKQLLITDLCGRLPHGVIFQFGGKEYHLLENINYSKDDGFVLLNGLPFSDCKPYLRPMSSMTEEEMGEYAKFKLSYDDVYEFTDFRATGKGFINAHTSCKNGGRGYTFQFNNRTMLYDGVIGIDWLNKYHFDYRGLIEMGLALEAPEGMYDN